MHPRIPYAQIKPEAIAAMRRLHAYVENTGLEHSLLELVKIRASQLNGCAYCLHMHVADALDMGETEERLALIAAWWESPLFTDRERAALGWVDALTLVHKTRAPAADFERLRAHFTEAEAVDLTVAIGEINVWNRLAVGFRAVHPIGEQAEAERRARRAFYDQIAAKQNAEQADASNGAATPRLRIETGSSAMQPRIDMFSANPAAINAVVNLHQYVRKSSIDHTTWELVKIRASQLNGCGFCLHMHTQEARKRGETQERIAVLPAWKESPLFTEQERAALAWTEALTLLSETGAPDADFALVRAHCSDAELVDLTIAIGEINIWNRLNVGFHTVHPVSATKAA